jgi:broad specificity polyphosphatase/5'/3'-nucleotidase SurE
VTLALVTNDDGVDSPGLHALTRLVAVLGLLAVRTPPALTAIEGRPT